MSFSKLLAASALALLAMSSVACTANTDAPEATDTSNDELSKARFTSLKTPSDARLGALYAAGEKLDNVYIGVYRFNKASVEATDPEARTRRIKEVMHRYMCGFFDESIDIGRNTGKSPVAAVLGDLNVRDNASDQDAKVAAFESALTKVYTDAKLDVLSGGASGNNTGGEIMGVYDLRHNEVFYFGYTNCGSDD